MAEKKREEKPVLKGKRHEVSRERSEREREKEREKEREIFDF